MRAVLVECGTKNVSGSCHNGDCCAHPQRGGSLLQVGRPIQNVDANAFRLKESDEAGKHGALKSGAGQSIPFESFVDDEHRPPGMSISTLVKHGLVKTQALASQASQAFTCFIYNTLSGPRSSSMRAPLQHGNFTGSDASDGKEFNVAAKRRSTRLDGVKNNAEKMPTFTNDGLSNTQAWRAFSVLQANHQRANSTLENYMYLAMPTPFQHWRVYVRVADAVIILSIVVIICIILSALLVFRQIQMGTNFEVSQLPRPNWNTGAQVSKPGEFFSPRTPIASPMLQRTMTNRPTGERRTSEGLYERLPSPSIISTGPNSSQCLCPCLVVPSGNECFLAVPTLKSIGISSNGSVSFDVKDMHGCTVLVMEASDVSWKQVSDHSQMKPAIVLRQASNKSGRSSASPPLACCKAGRVVEGERCMFIYDQQNAFFAYMKRDASKGCYLLTSARMGLQLMFFGNFEEHAVSVVNEIDEQKATLLATTEPAEMPFDTKKSFIKVRAGCGVDVGLILCGLTCIGLMERG
jgi:hypothetical protein